MATTISSLALPSSRTISYALTTVSSDLDAPTVLLSNSLCGPFATWDRVVPKLTSKGLNVLRYDQPGHGTSGVPADLSSTSFHTLADDVRELLNHLSIKRLRGWVGVSMGGATGMIFATKYPNIIQKLVVCNSLSCSFANAGATDVLEPMVTMARGTGKIDGVVDAILVRWFGRAWIDANPDEAHRMREVMLQTSIEGFETCAAALRSQAFDLRPSLTEVGHGIDEALFVVGEKDAELRETMQDLQKGVERGLKEKNEHASVDLQIIKNAGHVCYVDGYDEFVGVVARFLDH
ncbi:zearalenone lactonase [Annulohypoxylon truncatum]|uniref:zearalenone lactonase n=1 Tax=Annulohypoxylon truncatum TaxID=327061 RepID=UPI002007B8EC|nr:zearalenone lactonase [Annulohypoxylon truncatum]KAI1206792.1 zearalenone lactonase [Annulohypoxylon truncatum]